jgi:hypothetical protein
MIHNGKIVDHYVVWVKHIPSLQAYIGKPIQIHANYEGEQIRIHLTPMAGNQPGWRSNYNFGNVRSKENWKPISLHIENDFGTLGKSNLPTPLSNHAVYSDPEDSRVEKYLTEAIENAFAKNELTVNDCIKLIQLLTSKMQVMNLPSTLS